MHLSTNTQKSTIKSLQVQQYIMEYILKFRRWDAGKIGH